MIRREPAFFALLFVLTVSVSVFAQGRRNQQQQQQQQQQIATQGGVGPTAQSKDESDAFTALQKEQAPDKRVELAEAFITKYPNSDFVQYAHMFRLSGYGQLGKHKETIPSGEQAIDTTVKFGEKLVAKADADVKLSDKDKEAIKKKDKNAVFLDKDSPQFQQFMAQSEQRILAFYQAIIQSYQQLNDAPKMLE